MFGQSIFDISVLNVGLVTLLDSVGSGLASLPVVDGLDVVGLALRTDGGVFAIWLHGGCDCRLGARSHTGGSRLNKLLFQSV